MTPESFIGNLTTLATAILAPLGGLALATGTAAFVAGKLADNPGWVSWGRRGWMGAGVAFGAGAIGALIKNVATRVGGS